MIEKDCIFLLADKQMEEAQGLWNTNQPKPARPKEAFEKIQKISKIPRSGAIYSQITSRVSIKGCTDQAFRLLCDTFRQWFPPDEDP